MPAPGDQHKPNGISTSNPFEEQKPHISEYTAQEIATLQARLNKRLGPEYISTRSGPGGSKVAYLPAEKAINLANEVFGFNGWSSSIQNIQIDFVDENAQKGTISIGLSVVVRVTLRDGTYHEDTGYGGIENCKSKIAAFEKAKKEGTTDALKRALRNFGNVLGNCIYDKDYITKVSKVKAGTGKWDVNELHRHVDFAPKKEEEVVRPPINSVPVAQPTTLLPEDSFDIIEFDEADFDDVGNPDEVMLPPDTGPPKGAAQTSNLNHQQTPSKPPQYRPDQAGGPQRPQHNPSEYNSNRQPPHLRNNTNGQEPGTASRSSSPGIVSQQFVPPPPPQAPPGPQTAVFFSARNADVLDGNNNPVGSTAVSRFNPHADSPSIRKTAGVDHSSSMALNRKTLKVEPPLRRPPESDAAVLAKAGIPATGQAAQSPMPKPIGTSAYRPPTRYGPPAAAGNSPASGISGAERALMAAKRAPLSDLSNVQNNATGLMQEGSDVKRQRIGPGLSGNPNLENTGPMPG
ncbi:DNA repair protein rad52 [Neophaeococcomyces mojaviensis]|uniref:DNA repair protein rad52 n=1 Tax=Neophaeococcomyces mojaviensis TaxID=3383035 RepID=A0ACC3AC39_9EURO|nr:DNA repair protein rad52 [Knufia sp. JES_112]